MKKIIFKRRFRLRPKSSNKNIRYIKDKAVKNFLLQHLKPIDIDFSQVKSCLLFQMEEECLFDKIFPSIRNKNKRTNEQLNNNGNI